MATDLSISVSDEPGGFARAASALGAAGVNIDGLAGLGGGGAGHVHLLVEDAAGARRALEDAGFSIQGQREAVVLDVSGEDRPGRLGELAKAVGDAGINLIACYVATRSRVVFVADDAGALRAALGA